MTKHDLFVVPGGTGPASNASVKTGDPSVSTATEPVGSPVEATTDRDEKEFNPYRFGANTMPPGLRGRLLAAELPVVPAEDLQETLPPSRGITAGPLETSLSEPEADSDSARPVVPMGRVHWIAIAVIVGAALLLIAALALRTGSTPRETALSPPVLGDSPRLPQRTMVKTPVAVVPEVRKSPAAAVDDRLPTPFATVSGAKTSRPVERINRSSDVLETKTTTPPARTRPPTAPSRKKSVFDALLLDPDERSP